MKYLFAQQTNERFIWELKTVIYSLTTQGVEPSDIVILFAQDAKQSDLATEFADYDVHFYADERTEKTYIPSIRPFLWWKYLAEDSAREMEDYVYLDSDIVVLDKSIFDLPANNTNWYCSDTNSYLNRDYIMSVTNADTVLPIMEYAVGVPDSWVQTINKNSGGAQWVMSQPKARMWKIIYNRCIKLYDKLEPLDTTLQKWTAEMWAQLWGGFYYNIQPIVHENLNFVMSTNDEVGDCKIIHNAGITSDMTDKFFKGNYINSTPTYEQLQGFSGVSAEYCKYVSLALYGKE